MNTQQIRIIVVVLILLAITSLGFGIYEWSTNWGYKGTLLRVFLLVFALPILLGGGAVFALASKKKG